MFVDLSPSSTKAFLINRSKETTSAYKHTITNYTLFEKVQAITARMETAGADGRPALIVQTSEDLLPRVKSAFN